METEYNDGVEENHKYWRVVTLYNFEMMKEKMTMKPQKQIECHLFLFK